MIDCNKCGTETTNPKYCSRKCAISVSNRLRPKRQPKGRCKTCEIPILSQLKYCSTCTPMAKPKSMTIGEYRNKKSVRNKHRSWLHAHIRGFARSWHKEKLRGPCENCGYKLHVEACHIKPVSSFSDDTLLTVVNSRENILVLCRNCHWEFDHNLLDLINVQR
jgi:hypothetical protein